MNHMVLRLLGIGLVLLAACGPLAQKSQQVLQPPTPQIEVREYWEH